MRGIRFDSVDEVLEDGLRGEAGDANKLVARGMTADDLYLCASTVQPIGQEANQGGVGRVIHGWGRQFDAEFGAERAGDGIGGCTRLYFEGQQDGGALGGEEFG